MQQHPVIILTILMRMNTYIKCLPLTILLLTGCTTLSLVMKVDSELEANAIVYTVSYPDSLADKLSGNNLNVSFGPYRVSDADVSWAKSNSAAEDPQPMFQITDTEKSGNTTTTTTISGGPSELMGFSRQVAQGEPSIVDVIQTVSYTFKANKAMSWKAACTYKAQKRVIQYENRTDSELLASSYTCQYTPADNHKNNAAWLLAIDDAGTITMTQKGKANTYIAESTGGTYVNKDRQPVNHSAAYAGYTWKQNHKGKTKRLAAISTREDTPRVWLDKDNTAASNHALAMANAGLLIYSWVVNH